MNKPTYFVIVLFYTLVVSLSARADVENIWRPGGTHQDLKSFKEGDNYAGEDFRGSWFYDGGDIIGVNLDNTNWEKSSFVEMRIENTSFRGANLRSVSCHDLFGEMVGCDFTDADITGSELPLTVEQFRSTKNFKNKNFAGVTFRGVDLSGCSFAGFNLTGARLLGCNLKGCNFTNADISNIEATEMTLEQLKTTKSYKNKDLGETAFQQCDFDNVDFRGFKLGVFYDCSFRNADLTDALFIKTKRPWYYHQQAGSFDMMRIAGKSDLGFGFSNCALTREQFESTRTYRDKDFSWMIMAKMNLDQWDFRDCNLDDAMLVFSSLKDADLTDASVQRTDFSDTNMTRKQWLSTKTFRGTEKFIPPTTRGVDLSHYDFSGMTIKDNLIEFAKVNLKNADFTGASLINVKFNECDLAGADFIGATLENVLFEKSTLTWEQFLSTKNGKAKDFSRTTFSYSTVPKWDFSNTNLTGTRWSYCDFPDCNFDNATIDVKQFGTAFVKTKREDVMEHTNKGLTREQFESTANFRNKDLRGADFGFSELCGLNLSGFDLTNVEFWYANLIDVRFDDATVKGSTIISLAWSTQYQDRMESYKNTPMTKEQFYSTATYKSGIVEGVKFLNMDLTDWDFSKVKLVNCDFRNCTGAPTLQGAK